MVIINRGPTRGDELATLKIEAGCSETLAASDAAVERLEQAGAHPPEARRRLELLAETAEVEAAAVAAEPAAAVATAAIAADAATAAIAAGVAADVAAAVAMPAVIAPIANMLPMPPNSMLPISMPESMSVPLHRL